jgi:hypothetical protein
MTYESVPVPFITLPDGRLALTMKQIENNPYLLDFVRAFPAGLL